LTDAIDIAQELNKHFASIGSKMTESITSVYPSTTKELTKRKYGASRTNDIDTKFIKYAKSVIAPIVSSISNMCYETGTFLDRLKIAEIVPIWKKGDPKATNYRPISLRSQFDKILDKGIQSRLTNIWINTTC